MSHLSSCALATAFPPAASVAGLGAGGDAWPPRSLASELMRERSGLDCYRGERAQCVACRFALELPLALMRAADAAVQDGQSDEALGLIRHAFLAASALVPGGPDGRAAAAPCQPA